MPDNMHVFHCFVVQKFPLWLHVGLLLHPEVVDCIAWLRSTIIHIFAHVSLIYIKVENAETFAKEFKCVLMYSCEIAYSI